MAGAGSSAALHTPYGHRLERQRYYCLLIGFLTNFCNTINWTSFSAVSTSAALFYEESLTAINSLAYVFAVTFIPLMPVAIWFLERFGLKHSVRFSNCQLICDQCQLGLACFFNASGASIRFAATFAATKKLAFVLTIVGQILCAMAQPFTFGGISALFLQVDIL